MPMNICERKAKIQVEKKTRKEKLTLSPSRLRRPNSYLRILGELINPQLIQVLLVGYSVKVGDERPDLGIGKAIMDRVPGHILRID
jgi:hypothetical protein